MLLPGNAVTCIRFGTDGWRAEIGRGFTFANVRVVSQAICDLTRAGGAERAVVAYDRRFLARRAAQEVVGVLLGNGFHVRLSDRAEPTPALSCQVVESGAQLGIALTASHNPAEFLGLKVKTAAGASAPLEFTDQVEREIGRSPVRALAPSRGIALGRLEIGSFAPAHLARLRRVVDLDALRQARLRIAFDAMHGAAGPVVEDLLGDATIEVVTLRGERDPLFGGNAPEPTRDRLGPLLDAVGAGGFSFGFATDGDGDRIAAVDEHGEFVSPLRLIGVLALHLTRRRQVPGGLAKTFANTVYLDRIAAAEGRPFHCLPVGFKHIAALLARGAIAIGGEESGGIGFAGYLPERDGVLAGLLLLEAVATSGTTLAGLVAALAAEFGELHYDRIDLRGPADHWSAALARLRERPPERIAGMQVTGIDPLDGLKLLLGDEGWLLLRASGTEPVLRIYAETRTPQALAALLGAGRDLLAAALPAATSPPEPLK